MEQLEVVARTGRADVAEVFVARVDGDPDRLVEFVDGCDPPRPRHEKWIVNVSTQAGCPVGCPFCDAGTRFRGNLSADVILAQVDQVLDRHPAALRRRCQKLKVHFARMGEPALNPAVVDAIAALPERIPNPDLWACVPTTAPRGTEAWFAALFEVKRRRFHGRFQLQFSLNSTDPDTRRRLMPVPHADLEEIAALGRAFHAPGDRKVVLNLALARDIPLAPEVLRRHFDPTCFAVKLTPLNPTVRGREAGFTTVLSAMDPGAADAVVTSLRRAGFDVVVSIGDPREDEVGSNCGQAVRHFLGLVPEPNAGA